MRAHRILWLVPVVLAVGCSQPSGKTTPPAAGTKATTPGSTPPVITNAPDGPGVKGTTVSAPGGKNESADIEAEVVFLPPPPGAAVVTPENSKIEFVGTKPNGKHEGGFKKFMGGVEVDGKGVTKISVEIDANSLYSDNPKLTGHLKSPDFFDVKSHPKLSFTSKSIKAEAGKDTTHLVTGELKMLAAAKDISVPAKIDATADNVSITSEFTISRSEFGMTYGKGKVDDPVTIKVSIKAPRK